MPGKTGDSCEVKYYLHKIFSFVKLKYKNASKNHFFKAAPVQSCPPLSYLKFILINQKGTNVVKSWQIRLKFKLT